MAVDCPSRGRPPKDAAAALARRPPVPKRGDAVHPDVADSGGEAVRLEGRPSLGERLRVEDDDVGGEARAEEAAVAEPESLGGLPGEAVDGLGR
jgi:hypothetical protein